MKQTKPYKNGWIHTTPSLESDDGDVFACSVGAAEYAMTKPTHINGSDSLSKSLRHVLLNTRLPFTDWPDPVKSELNGAKAMLLTVITTCNDLTSMSRKGIAEWIGWLIDEKGYDLDIEMPETEPPLDTAERYYAKAYRSKT